MDKKSILGMVLIAVVIAGWMFYNSTTMNKNQQNKAKNTTTAQTAQAKKPADTNAVFNNANPQNQISDSAKAIKKFGQYFAPLSYGNEQFITVETDLYTAIISSKGAVVREWTLKKYKKWDKVPTQLIWDKAGELGITINSRDSEVDTIDTRNLYFTIDTKGQNNYKLKQNDSLTLTAVLQVDSNSAIVKKFTFHNGKYHLDAAVTMQNMDKFIRSKRYDFEWKNGLRYQEMNSVDESGDAHALIVNNGEQTELDAKDNEQQPISPTGVLDFAAIKTKYFAMAIIPQPFRSQNISATAKGRHEAAPEKGQIEKYNLSVRVNYEGGNQTNNFRVYMGPLEYDVVSEYGIETLVNFGWKLIVRPIGEYFMLPFFKMIHSFVPNFGISILIFSLIMKFLLYPFSITQMRSSQKMKLIAPEMNAIREKYKDDQKTQQQETMKLYSQYGVNPAGGCLPLLLQMPILYALWAVMRNAIDLRQADFAFWITDLSLPDYIVQFPFSILGITHLSGLSLLMGITMFIQQKMTITDPRQKAMVYMMPIMFTLMFAYFPAGLNLYYFTFNILSIAQQYYINNFSKKKLTLEDLKKSPKKEGWLQKKMREAQEIAQAQGKLPPNANKYNQNNNNPNNKNFQNKKKPNKK